MVNIQLNQLEVRVLGSLMEKETTTPDYYPLSLNALVNACNQKSNRDPVMDVDESAVREVLYSLGAKGLAGPVSSADSRVTKYEHRMQEIFNFTRRESAIICVLLLRGPQTPGELRGRTERMFRFDDLADVQSTLAAVGAARSSIGKDAGSSTRHQGSALRTSCWPTTRRPGKTSPSPLAAANDVSAGSEQIATLEETVARLEQEFAALRKEFTESTSPGQPSSGQRL